jgi:hypothetical protein
VQVDRLVNDHKVSRVQLVLYDSAQSCVKRSNACRTWVERKFAKAQRSEPAPRNRFFVKDNDVPACRNKGPCCGKARQAGPDNPDSAYRTHCPLLPLQPGKRRAVG